MLRVEVARGVTRRPYLRWAAWCALVAIALVAVGWRLLAPAASGPAGSASTTSLPGLIGSAVLVGIAGWWVMHLQGHAAAAREARTRLQALTDVLDVWQWQTDVHHRVVLLRPPANAATVEWSATPASAPLWESFRPADAAGLRARLESGASLHDIEVHREDADGTLVRGRLRGRPLTDAVGAFAGYLGTLRDEPMRAPDTRSTDPLLVTESGEAPAEAVDSAHDAFSYTVSHDLRAPIRVVEGFTKIVKEDYGSALDRVGLDHLERILGAAARMNSMIDALLALSKLSSQPLARQPVNLSQLATFVAEDLRRQWPGRELTFDVMSGMEVRGDPTLLRVVLENLLGNAWKYTSQCREAQVRFDCQPGDPPTFTIADNGAGFDMRFADRLFGVFQRLHSASEFPGTGVGLASVRRIIRRHGGDIWAEAELERGARFHFTLPQSQSQSQSPR